MRVVGRGVERPEEHDHAGKAEGVAQLLDVGRDDAEVLGDHWQLAELALRRPEHRLPRALYPAAVDRGLRARRHLPVGGEAAEVVDPREVDEREHAPQPLDPPAVAVRRHGVPVEDAGCPRAGPSGPRSSGGAPATTPSRNSSRVREWSQLPSADRSERRPQPDAALRRVLAKRRPLPLEANLILEAPVAGEAQPSRRSRRGSGAGSGRPRASTTRALGVGEDSGPAGECGRRRIGGAVLVGRAEGQHLPPRDARPLEPVDEAVRLLAKPPVRQRGRVQQDPARTAKLHRRLFTDSASLKTDDTCPR